MSFQVSLFRLTFLNFLFSVIQSAAAAYLVGILLIGLYTTERLGAKNSRQNSELINAN